MELKTVFFALTDSLFLLGSAYLSYAVFVRRLTGRRDLAPGLRPGAVKAALAVGVLVLILPVVQVIFSYILWGIVTGSVEAHNAMEGLVYMAVDACILTYLTARGFSRTH